MGSSQVTLQQSPLLSPSQGEFYSKATLPPSPDNNNNNNNNDNNNNNNNKRHLTKQTILPLKSTPNSPCSQSSPSFNDSFLNPWSAPSTPQTLNFSDKRSSSGSALPLTQSSQQKLQRKPSTAPQLSRQLSRQLSQSSRFGIWTVVLLFIAIAMVILTALYSMGSAKNLMRLKVFTQSPSNAILVLRILTEIGAVSMAALTVVVVEDLQWALASRPKGVSLVHFVGLDSGTGVWGLVRLFATAEWNQKSSSLFRLMAILCIPLPGIILMGDIHIEPVFFPEKASEVAAGIADFNSSLISRLSPMSTTALLVQMGNPVWSDRNSQSVETLPRGNGHCTTTSTNDWAPCDEAHFMAGGIETVSPLTDDLTSYPSSTAYVIPKLKGYHVEYGQVHDIIALHDTGECHLTGSASAASYWCSSVGPSQELLFGCSYCPLSLQQNSSCLTTTSWTDSLELGTSMFVYRRYATVNYSRANFSILSISDLSDPKPYPIPLGNYLQALSSVVPGFVASSSSSSGDNSALAQYAVSALPIDDNLIARRICLKATRRAMSVPLEYFHANYISSMDPRPFWELDTPRKGLESDMYTNMSIAIISNQVVAGRISRWLFVGCAGSLLVVCVLTIIATAWISERRPERCGYASLDFAAVCAKHRDDHEGGTGGITRSLTMLKEKPSGFGVARSIGNERIVLK